LSRIVTLVGPAHDLSKPDYALGATEWRRNEQFRHAAKTAEFIAC
jgi:hypothetical protein